MENEKILLLFSIILNKNTHNKDIIHLFHLLNDTKIFTKIITLFDGRTVDFPKKEEVNEAMLLALIYYYRYEKKLEWKEIQNLIPFEFNPLSYSLKIRNLNNTLSKELRKVLDGQS